MNKATITVVLEYSNFANVLSLRLVAELPEHTEINNDGINLVDRMRLRYGLIHSLESVELEVLIIYIKTHYANCFIIPSKLALDTLILFLQKPNDNFCLCIDYLGYNNLTIKNCYILPLIGKSLNRLRWAKEFIKLDLTGSYYLITICKSDK